MKGITSVTARIGIALFAATTAQAQMAPAADQPTRDGTGSASPSTAPIGRPQEVKAIPGQAPGDQRLPPLPPAVLTMVTLGNAGLLQSVFSLEHSGIAEARLGEARASIGFAHSSGIAHGYKDQDRALVAPVSVMKSFPLGSGTGFLRVGESATIAGSDHNQEWNDGSVLRTDAQFLYAPDTSQLIGIGVVYQRTRFDNHYKAIGQRGTSNRDGWGARIDYAARLSDHLGFTARGQYTRGDYSVDIPAAGYSHIQNLNDYYVQSEIVGTFRAADFSLVPKGWVLHPTLGANFHYGQFEHSPDSFGMVSGSVVGPDERYGTIWGDLRLERAAAMSPGVQILPFVTGGIEREYINNLDVLIHEANYGHVAAGFAVTAFGQRMDLSYNNYLGFHGRRGFQYLLIATSLAL